MKASSRTQQLKNRRGLHERPAVGIVETANRPDAELTVCRVGNCASVRSIFEIFLFWGKHGNSLELLAVGHNADTALNELTAFLHAYRGVGNPCKIRLPMGRLIPLLRNVRAAVHLQTAALG